MPAVTIEWIAVITAAMLFTAVIVGEALWLIRNQWARPGRAIVFVMATSVAALAVGTFVSFVILGVMLAMAWDGSLSSISGGEITLWIALAFAFLSPPVVLIGSKRLLLSLMTIATGKRAWQFSFAVSAMLLLAVVIPPFLAFYLF